MSGFVTHTEYQKHIRGEWRTVHNLWPHIRKYVPAYGYSRAEIDAMFEGYSGGGKALIDAANVGGLTAGSIPFADALGYLDEDNAALFWDAAQDFLGVGVGAPLCRTHIRGAVCPDYAGLHPDTVLLLENNDNVTLQFQCSTTGEARIRFCDDDFNPSAGTIDYEFGNDYMIFGVATALNMYLTPIGLGVGNIIPTNELHVFGPGTDEGGLAGGADVVARFQQTLVGHCGISIDALAGKDPVLYLAEDGEAQWDIRNDASESDEFQIRYQGRAVVNRTDFKIDTAGNVFVTTGHLDITKATTLLIDLNPGFTGTGEVINITPSAALDVEDAEWDGINIDGNLLDPDAIGCFIHGLHLDFSTVDMTNEPHIDALHVMAPRTSHIERVHAIHTNHGFYMESDLTTLVAGMRPTYLNVVIDDEGATGGDAHILDVARAGGGTVSVAAVATHTGVDVVHQHIGTPTAFDQVWRFNGGWVDATAECGGVGDIALWIAQDDVVYFGHATTFDEIECIWDTVATKSMHFQFHYSDGATGWVRFYPTDDTNGAQMTGIVHWLATDIPAWAADTVNAVANKYWIRITRTRLAGTGPTESTIKFIKGISYEWDKLGAVNVLSVSVTNHIALRSNAELRFYDNGNYIGFEAPALGADQIWVLPNADGANGEHMVTDGAGNLSWTTGAGTGNVNAGANITDHAIVRGDGGAKAVQDTGILIDDNDVMTFPDGGSINLQEDITFTGATGVNLVKFPDNLADALSFMEGANPYQTFITTNGSEAIQFHEDVLLKGSTEYGAGNKTTGAWAKSIGGGGDYADWATMIVDMPDLIAHAVTVTIEYGTTLTELCDIRNKHGVTSAASITVQAERYFPTAGDIPTADSATATTLRDAALAAAALGNDYFNGCWVIIVDGTGTDNGFVVITDYVDATGDVVVAAWPGTQPDNTSRYIIVGALIDAEDARAVCFWINANSCDVAINGIGITSSTELNFYSYNNFYIRTNYCVSYDSVLTGFWMAQNLNNYINRCGIVKNNTGNNASYGGVIIYACNYALIAACGISDNNQRGVLIRAGGAANVSGCFGDANGAWGTYAINSGQVWLDGTECSGAAGNHSDPGTAGNANADQAAAF